MTPRFPNPFADDPDRDPPHSALWTVAGVAAGAVVGAALLVLAARAFAGRWP